MELTDNFNRADGALGSDWTAAQNELVIVSNKVQGSTLSSYHLQVSKVSGDVGPDQFAECDKTNDDVSYNRAIGPAVSITDAGGGLASFYWAQIVEDGNLYVRCKDAVTNPVDGFTGDLIGSGSHPHTTPGETYRVRLEKVDDDVIVYTNGVERARVSNSTLTGDGKPGLVCMTYLNNPANYKQLDNFVGGDYVPDTTPPELVSLTVPEDGGSIIAVFNEPVSGTDGQGWTISSDGGAIVVESATGNGTNTITFIPDRTIDYGEVLTFDYDEDEGDYQDLADNDLLNISDFAVTNNSTNNIPVAPTMNVASATMQMDDTNRYHLDGSATGYPIPTFSLSGPDAALFEIECPVSFPLWDGDSYEPHDYYDRYALKWIGSQYESPDPDANADGTYEVTVTGTNSEGEDSTDYSIVVNEASTSPTPELPRVTVDTSLPEGWDGTADVSGNLSASDLANALLTAAATEWNRTYVIQLTKATSRSMLLKAPKMQPNSKLVIRTSGYLHIAEYGDRTIPGEDSANYATIKNIGTDPAMWAEWQSHDIRLIGIEIATDYASLASTVYNLIDIGRNPLTDSTPSQVSDLPTDIIFDRCYIHGTTSGNCRRGVMFNAIRGAVIGCHIDECHEVGSDSQAIALYNTPGPLRFYNNFLEGAGENFIIGGSDPVIKYCVPSDIEFINNYVHKPLRWKADDPSYDEVGWSIKNLFELKLGERVLIEGNVFDGIWPAAQHGTAVLFTPRNQSLAARWSIINDITFNNNLIKNASRLIDIMSSDVGDTLAAYGITSRRIMRISCERNLGFTSLDYGANLNPMVLLLNGGQPAENISFHHNTFISLDDSIGSSTAVFDIGDSPLVANNFFCQNNALSHCNYGIRGVGIGSGHPALDMYFANWTVDNNVLFFPADHINPGDYSSAYPGNSLESGYAGVGFVDFDGTDAGDYSLTALSDYHNAATDDTDLGYAKPAFDAAIATALTGNDLTGDYVLLDYGSNTGAGGIDVTVDTTGGKFIVALVASLNAGSGGVDPALSSGGGTPAISWNPLSWLGSSGIEGLKMFWATGFTTHAAHIIHANANFPFLGVLVFDKIPFGNDIIDSVEIHTGTGATSAQPGTLTPDEAGQLFIAGLSTYAGGGENHTINQSFNTGVKANSAGGVNIGGFLTWKQTNNTDDVDPTFSWSAASARAAMLLKFGRPGVPPTITNEGTFNVTEGANFIGTVLFDGDVEAENFEITGGDDELITIDTSTGDLNFLDAAEIGTYEVTVRCYNTYGEDTADFEIVVSAPSEGKAGTRFAFFPAKVLSN